MNAAQWLSVFSLGIVVSAHPATVKNLDFNLDGVFPTAGPDIRLFNNTGQFEADLFTVEGGLLHQLTAEVNGSALYNYPNNRLTNGTLNPALDVTMETRLRILQITGRAGAVFEAFNGAVRLSASFTNGGVVVRTAAAEFSPVISVALGQFHTYRLEARGGGSLVRLLVDSNLVFEGIAPANTTLNGFSWGDGDSTPGVGADVDWDYVRVSQGPPPAPRITRVRAHCDEGNTVTTVTFNKPVALDGDYTLDGVPVLTRSHGANEAEVVITTPPLVARTSYALTISGVHDTEMPAHEMEPNPTLWIVGCVSRCGDLVARVGTEGAVVIEWNDAVDALESSTNLLTWLEVPAARSPFIARPPLRGTEFFRLRCADGARGGGLIPVFIAHPASRTANVGETVSFHAAAIGAGPLRYQWLFYGTNLAGATNASLTLSNVALAQMGVYELSVSNGFGMAVTRPAYLDFRLPPGLPFNTLVAVPDVSVLLVGRNNSEGLALNTTIAQPDVSVFLLGLNNTGGLARNTTMAEPPVEVLLLGRNNTGGIPFNTTLAQPEVTTLLLGLNNTGGLAPTTAVAQPPVVVEVTP